MKAADLALAVAVDLAGDTVLELLRKTQKLVQSWAYSPRLRADDIPGSDKHQEKTSPGGLRGFVRLSFRVLSPSTRFRENESYAEGGPPRARLPHTETVSLPCDAKLRHERVCRATYIAGR